MGVRGRAANVVGKLFSGRAAQSCSAAEPLTPALWSGSLFSGRAAQSCSAAEPLTPAFAAAEPLNIYGRANIFFERAHMKREMFQSDTMSHRLKTRQKAEKSRPKGRSSVRAPMGSSPFHYGRLFQSVKRALFNDRGDFFVHFLYV